METYKRQLPGIESPSLHSLLNPKEKKICYLLLKLATSYMQLWTYNEYIHVNIQEIQVYETSM